MLPKFLVIGAMKAGSTTLYADLAAQPSIFLPEKERASFHEADIVTAKGRTRYEALFDMATAAQVPGEVSERYAKLPGESGEVLERAAAVLGSEFFVVYIVRDPVDRTVSQHYHELSKRTIDEPSVDIAVRSVPRLIDYSRYAFQLRPWVELVGAERVHVVKFEDYRDDRAGGLAGLLDFLRAGPLAHSPTLDTVYNDSETKTVTTGAGRTLTQSAIYRRYLRRWLPEGVRRTGRNAIVHGVPARPRPPTLETVDHILAATRPDLGELQGMGLRLPTLWDLDATRRRYEQLNPG